MQDEQNDDLVIENKDFSFQDTTSTEKVFALTKRIRAVKGGTSASKTVSILVWHIDFCQQKYKKPTISTIGSESFPHLNLGAIRDFKALMMDRGYWNPDRWNATKSFYTFETGNILEFMSFDTYGKAHGPRRDTLFLNECNNLPWNIVDQLMLRTRKIVWMDWNPVEEFWFHEEVLPHRADDLDYITLTYKDNQALDEITVKEIESHKHNKQWWDVYGLGKDGMTETRVYPTWEVIDEIPEEAILRRRGLDFGYANDPSALTDIWEWNKAFVVDEVIYEKGLTNDVLAKKIGKDSALVVADSSEPKSIAEIAQYNVPIIGAKKGKGSITHGIDAVRSRKIYVTKRSLNIIKENKSYKYMVDKNGKILNEPEDVLNHAMDSIRYAIANLIPDAEEEDAYVQPEYEAPGVQESSPSGYQPQLTLTKVVTGMTHKERMKKIMDMRRNDRADSADSYVSKEPWQAPGV